MIRLKDLSLHSKPGLSASCFVAMAKKYNPLISYDWSTTTTSGLRYLKDVGSTPTYNASMYFGRGVYLNGVDQTITVPINKTIQTSLKRVNGVVTISEASQTLTNYVISGLGVHKDYYLFTRLLTTAEKDSYTNTPEAFYAMAQADSTCVLNMPMCETDGYARNIKSYSEGVELVNKYVLIDYGSEAIGSLTYNNGVYTQNITTTSTNSRYPRANFSLESPILAGKAYKYEVDYEVLSGNCGLTGFYNGSIFGTKTLIGKDKVSIVSIGTQDRTSHNIYFDGRDLFSVKYWNLSVKELTGAYPITNYTSSVRDNAKNLQYGLQTCKFVRDSFGVIQSASSYLECNVTGYATIPSHTNKVNIKMTVNPTSLSGNLLSGGVTKTLSGLTLNVDNNVVINNVTPTGAITLASGFTGTIKSYKEELV